VQVITEDGVQQKQKQKHKQNQKARPTHSLLPVLDAAVGGKSGVLIAFTSVADGGTGALALMGAKGWSSARAMMEGF
jgi:hypothetical protein